MNMQLEHLREEADLLSIFAVISDKLQAGDRYCVNKSDAAGRFVLSLRIMTSNTSKAVVVASGTFKQVELAIKNLQLRYKNTQDAEKETGTMISMW